MNVSRCMSLMPQPVSGVPSRSSPPRTRFATREEIRRSQVSFLVVRLPITSLSDGSAPANDRMRGFKEVIDGDSRFEIVRSQSGDFTRAKGKEVMEAFLKSRGDEIDAVYAHNDDMALGAIQAIEEAGKTPGVDIIVVSIDGVREAFEAMVAGRLNATVECNPRLGPMAFDAVEAILAGEEVP